jgi:hypothetical protein
MTAFVQWSAAALLVALGALAGGCGSSAGSLTSGGVLAGDASRGLTRSDDPMARPIGVAWTSARARRCGFSFDGAKLRSNYLSWEASQGASGERLAKIEQSYDRTYKIIWEKVTVDAGYCTDKKSTEINAELQRHLGGDYTPNLPLPKVAASCGVFGCGPSRSEQPFDSKDFWKNQDANPRGVP